MAYYGQVKCEAKLKKGGNCKYKAYYLDNQTHLCGVHSNKNTRAELPKNPNKDIETKEFHQKRFEKIEETAKTNLEKGRIGKIICTKLRMRKEIVYQDGFLAVFPNNLHQNRRDGFGCCSLSPMRMGPVDHKQPGLSPAKNLENFHQGNKVFPSELENGEPGPKFFQLQKEIYQDEIPHRHKILRENKSLKVKKEKPVYSIWIRPDGSIVKKSYIESRELYCYFYEQFARENSDFYRLAEMLDDGYNLEIFGYDGDKVDCPIDQLYLDPKKPFGHEMVPYTMLTVTNPAEYPWRKHAIEFK